MRYYGPFGHTWINSFGGLFGVLVFAAFMGLLVWALLRLLGHEHPHPGASAAGHWAPRDDALNAARIRYARGELDRDQYFRLVEDLTGVPRPAEPPAAGSFPAYPAPPAPPAGPAPSPEPGAPAAERPPNRRTFRTLGHSQEQA